MICQFYEIFNRNEESRQKELKYQVNQTRKQLASISAMDQFSKWAKLNRKLEQLTKKYEQAISSNSVKKTSFKVQAGLVLRVISWLIQAIMVYYMYSEAMFYLPQKWLGNMSWLGNALRFPAAPEGSISLFIWMLTNRALAKEVLGFKFL